MKLSTYSLLLIVFIFISCNNPKSDNKINSTEDNLKNTNEWNRRSHLGMERLELLSPDLTKPLPGLLTGMFFSNDGKTLYITNLGKDLLKYDF